MNPPRYLSKISTNQQKLDELEFKFLDQYDRAEQRLEKLRDSYIKAQKKLRSLQKLPRTKTQQKLIKQKISDIKEKAKTVQSTKRSISQKLKTVHSYQQMAESGFEVNRYARAFDRKSDDNRIVEKMQTRQFITPLTLSSTSRNKILLHAKELQKKEFSQIPTAKSPQKRYVLGLKVDENLASPKRDIVEKKINNLRLEWFRKSIDNLQATIKKTKSSFKQSELRREIKKLKEQRKKQKTPKECKQYIKSNYSRIANTNGVTYISTPYRVGFDGDDITMALNELIANYRLKEKNIDVVSLGVIERKIGRKQRDKIDYRRAEWEEIEQI